MSVLFLVFSEYLAIFKKTVAMHEVFLCRVAAHPILRKDLNFHVFLEYNQDVSIENWISGKRNQDVLLWWDGKLIKRELPPGANYINSFMPDILVS